MAEGTIDPRVILGLGVAAEDDLASRPSHHDTAHDHDHDDFESIVVNLPEQEDAKTFADRVEALANQQNILRVKGYAAVRGKPMRLLLQAVGARVRTQFDRPWGADEPRQGKVVVIAEHDDIHPDAIRTALGA